MLALGTLGWRPSVQKPLELLLGDLAVPFTLRLHIWGLADAEVLQLLHRHPSAALPGQHELVACMKGTLCVHCHAKQQPQAASRVLCGQADSIRNC